MVVDKGRHLVFFLALLMLFSVCCSHSAASYLDSVSWGNAYEELGSRSEIPQSFVFDDHPAFWEKEQRFLLDMDISVSMLAEKRVKAGEPASEIFFFNKPCGPSLSRVNIKLFSDKRIFIGLHKTDGFISDYSGVREDRSSKGNTLSITRLEDRGNVAFFDIGVTLPIGPEGSFVGIFKTKASGFRNMLFERLNGRGEKVLEFREASVYKGSSWGIDLFSNPERPWIFGLSYYLPLKMKMTSYSLDISAENDPGHEQPAISGGHFWTIPARFRVMIGRRSRRKLLAAEVRWVRFSKASTHNGFVRNGGTGFFFGSEEFKKYALIESERKEILPVAYHDSVAIGFGCEDWITKKITLRFGSSFSTHYANNRVVTPKFSAGFGMKLAKHLKIDIGGSFSQRDYFGDGLFWAKDQRISEAEFKFLSSLRFRY
ncbi:hypothetical protein ACFL6Y_06610 [Elusimicrobiota bacterium]